MKSGIIGCFFVLAICLASAQSLTELKNISYTIETILENNDPRVRPNLGGTPVEVGISMYLLSIPDVDDNHMRFTSNMYFRQSWNDPRLVFHPRPRLEKITLMDALEIWQPDTFFPNGLRTFRHDFSLPNTFVKILPSGEVLKSQRISVTMSCQMNFRFFPMDKQTCSLEIESYGYTMKDIAYKWLHGSSSVGISAEVSIPKFTILGHRLITKHVNLSTGNYSRLTLEILLSRNVKFYVFTVYVPAMLVLLFAWLTLWLSPRTNATRLSLSVVALGFHLVVLVVARVYTPSPACTLNPLDVYVGASLIGVLVVVVHHALVSQALLHDDYERNLDEKGEKEKKFSALHFEKYLRAGLVGFYVLFNFIYWLVLTQASAIDTSNVISSM